jgi:hypothetical protein
MENSPALYRISDRPFRSENLKNADGTGLAYAGRRCSVKITANKTETR